MPPVIPIASPENSVIVESVVTIGETENFEIMKPLMKPQRLPTIIATKTAITIVATVPAFSISKNLPVKTIAARRLDRLAVATMERSIPPCNMQRAMPKARTATSDSWNAILESVCPLNILVPKQQTMITHIAKKNVN